MKSGPFHIGSCPLLLRLDFVPDAVGILDTVLRVLWLPGENEKDRLLNSLSS